MTESSERPKPQIQRARSIALPTWVWMVGGALLVLWGLWALRPRTQETVASPTTVSAVATVGTAAHALVVQRPELVVLGSAVPQPDVPTSHVVQAGEGLSTIAQQMGVSQEALMAANGISDPNTIYAGQLLVLPSSVTYQASAQQLLPDSELLYGPAYQNFDVRAFIEAQGGHLASYQEEVEREQLDGPAIIERVSERYSVGPRLLLALLEYESGWVTKAATGSVQIAGASGTGLFQQLSSAASSLNEGYYNRIDGRSDSIRFADGTRATVASGSNAATVALQTLFARGGTAATWADDLASDGFIASYRALFGDPFAHEVADVLPSDLTQPELAIPWATGEQWYFTGGPHGGWVDSSSWAAIDFAAPDITGCYYSEYFVRSASAGVVVRSENGEVVVDLDGDGFAGTGWVLLYMHMAERVAVGTQLQVGDVIGRPSCEGGISDAAHLHLARRYNGQWISATGTVPFTLGGWVAEGADQSYDGYLVRGSERKEACACRDDALNGIVAP